LGPSHQQVYIMLSVVHKGKEQPPCHPSTHCTIGFSKNKNSMSLTQIIVTYLLDVSRHFIFFQQLS
jgi:hypothetical protein